MELDINKDYKLAQTPFSGRSRLGGYGAQKGWKYDPSNFNSNLGHFPGQMVKNGDYVPSAPWIELSENQNFKKIGPGVPKIWAKKGAKKANF